MLRLPQIMVKESTQKSHWGVTKVFSKTVASQNPPAHRFLHDLLRLRVVSGLAEHPVDKRNPQGAQLQQARAERCRRGLGIETWCHDFWKNFRHRGELTKQPNRATKKHLTSATVWLKHYDLKFGSMFPCLQNHSFSGSESMLELVA